MTRNVKALFGAIFIFGAFGLYSQSRRSFDRPVKFAVRGTHGALATGTDSAAEAGMKLFFTGGNAIDAGIATMLASSVVEYSHFGFGGEAPILIRTKDGKVISLSGVGTMPKSATAELFRTRTMKPGEVQNLEPNGLKGMVPVAGIMPAVVPGMVESALVALREYGTKSFAEVVEPSIELADESVLDETRAVSIARSKSFFSLWPTSMKYFYPPGFQPAPGAIFRQTDLARTLRSMAAVESRALKAGASRQAAIDAVRDYFYRGEIARKIDAFSRANDGLLRYEDMAAFRLEPEEPLQVNYRGYTVYKPGFYSQGPVFLQTLNVLERFDLRRMQHNSTEYLHTLTEAMKLGYADRDTYYGDPKFSNVPEKVLLSKEYAEQRAAQIAPQASLLFRAGSINGKKLRHPSEEEIVRIPIDDNLMARDTTCVTAADKEGNVFVATPSGAWLPSVIAGDTGIPLTQRAQSFLLIPGHPNELAGGKRPRVTLSPTLVMRDGKPYLTMSTPGGDNQDQALLQLFMNVVEFGMNAQQAVEAARIQTRHLVSSFDNHAMSPGDLLLDERISGTVFQELTERGHRTGQRSRFGSGSAPVMLRFTPEGALEAGADPYGYRTARAW